MAKKKKTIIAFLMLISFLWGTYTTVVKGISQELNIPIPILLLFILILYLIWKEEEEEAVCKSTKP